MCMILLIILNVCCDLGGSGGILFILLMIGYVFLLSSNNYLSRKSSAYFSMRYIFLYLLFKVFIILVVIFLYCIFDFLVCVMCGDENRLFVVVLLLFDRWNNFRSMARFVGFKLMGMLLLGVVVYGVLMVLGDVILFLFDVEGVGVSVVLLCIFFWSFFIVRSSSTLAFNVRGNGDLINCFMFEFGVLYVCLCCVMGDFMMFMCVCFFLFLVFVFVFGSIFVFVKSSFVVYASWFSGLCFFGVLRLMFWDNCLLWWLLFLLLFEIVCLNVFVFVGVFGVDRFVDAYVGYFFMFVKFFEIDFDCDNWLIFVVLFFFCFDGDVVLLFLVCCCFERAFRFEFLLEFCCLVSCFLCFIVFSVVSRLICCLLKFFVVFFSVYVDVMVSCVLCEC